MGEEEGRAGSRCVALLRLSCISAASLLLVHRLRLFRQATDKILRTYYMLLPLESWRLRSEGGCVPAVSQPACESAVGTRTYVRVTMNNYT